MSEISSIGIAGAGRVGRALGRLLYDRGQPIVAIAGRDLSRTAEAAKFIGSGVQAVAYADLPTLASRLIIAVPDDALPSVTRTLADSENPVRIALHTCGSRGPEALAALEELGASCGALHPLQTIATPEQGVADLPGSYFGITASGPALDWAFEICGLLDGSALNIPPESRPLYHAAAVMASNYIMAMIDAAVILFKQSGVAEDQALAALAPMIRASVENTLAKGPVAALTGPIERGDQQTVASHLRALENAGDLVPETVKDLYSSGGLHAAAIARRKSPAIDRRAIESFLHEGLHERLHGKQKD
jgi:predicted short-subunit dehydrogenase-like oxidoreductase (DUF2520 family)